MTKSFTINKNASYPKVVYVIFKGVQFSRDRVFEYSDSVPVLGESVGVLAESVIVLVMKKWMNKSTA